MAEPRARRCNIVARQEGVRRATAVAVFSMLGRRSRTARSAGGRKSRESRRREVAEETVADFARTAAPSLPRPCRSEAEHRARQSRPARVSMRFETFERALRDTSRLKGERETRGKTEVALARGKTFPRGRVPNSCFLKNHAHVMKTGDDAARIRFPAARSTVDKPDDVGEARL